MLRVAEQYAGTDTGRQRRANEDSLLARAPLFVVADGMGGAQAGEVASRIAVESFQPGLPESSHPELELAALARAANTRIHELSHSNAEQAGMGTTIGDYNGDGRLDIFKTNFSDDTPVLYRNDGGGIFSDVTLAAGLGLHTQYLGWGTMFFDFDNDSWPDLILVNGHVYPEVDKFHLGSGYMEPRLLYHNNGNATFTDISATAGPGINAVSSARGLAVGDLWNDGQLSVVIVNVYAKPSLLVNTVHSGNHWVAFKTIGTRSNRDGIGAKITVKVGKRTLVDEVRSGSSYISQNDMRVHFGLGLAAKLDAVQVRWPSGLIESFNNLPVDTINILKEGSGNAVGGSPKKP